jgi:hypothetical protein
MLDEHPAILEQKTSIRETRGGSGLLGRVVYAWLVPVALIAEQAVERFLMGHSFPTGKIANVA